MSQLRGKVFLITGAGSGIGEALAKLLDSLDAQVILIDINQSALKKVANQLKQTPLTFSFCVSDAHKWRECRATLLSHFDVETTSSKHLPIDGVINNAGIAHESAALEDISEQDFKRVMDVNFYGVLNGTQTFLADLKLREKAWLVNISSIFGVTAITQLSAYCASKFAVKGLTESLRMEALSSFPHVNVMVVHPGGIDTPIAHNAIAMRDRDEQEREKEAISFSKSLVTSPSDAANAIIKGIIHHKSRVLIGKDAKLMDFLARLFPSKYVSIVLKEILRRKLIKI